MSNLLELLGKGLESPFMDLVLPGCHPLTKEEAHGLTKEVESNPGHTANKLRLAIHYAQIGSLERSDQLFAEIAKQLTPNTEARLAWAATLFSAGSPEEALKQLEQAYEQHPNDSRVLFGIGYYYERAGQSEKAIEYYQRGAKNKPYLRQARQRLGAIKLQNNDYAGAIVEYEALLQEHPEDVSIYLFLGQMYLHTKEHHKAIESFERALTIEPDNFELHDDYVESLVQSGQLREAIEQMHKIIDEQGEFPDNYLRLADLYCNVGNDEAAVSHYERALELHPGYLEAAVKLGTQHLRMSRFCEAAANFNRAIEINDQLITAYVGLGIAQKCNSKGEEAADTLELASALELNTNLLFAEMSRLQLKVALSQKIQRDYFTLYEEKQDPQQEINDLLDLQIERHRQGLLENPNHADLHYRYGLLLKGRGKTEEAIKHFRMALQINPSYLKARTKLGLALRETGRMDEGIQQLREALQIKPEYADLHYRLGLMYCDKMQFALAVEHFEIALHNTPKNINVHSNLALALQNIGLIDRANASWRAVCELDPQSTLAFQAQRELITLNPNRESI